MHRPPGPPGRQPYGERRALEIGVALAAVGIAVMALPLADVGNDGWRLVYVVTLAWLTVAG